jgi:ankyrin repeat protein
MRSYRFSVALLITGVLFVLLASPVAAKDKWIKVRTKNFNIVSNADEAKARQLGLKLEQFRAVLGKILNLTNDASIPVSVLLFKSDDSFKPFKPLYNGKPANIAGYFQAGEDENTIALSVSNSDQRPLHTIFHEYTHLLTSQGRYEYPLWLNEGIAEFYSTFNIDKNQATVGIPIENHVYLLRENKFMPLQNLIKVDHRSPDYNERDRQGVFYAQSWALVHFLIMGNKHARQQQVVQFLTLLNSGASAERAFLDAFKTDFTAIEKELRNYIGGNTYPILNFNLDSTEGEKEFAVEQLTDAQAQFHLGNLLLHTNRIEEAENYFKQAIALDAGFNRSYEGLGFAAMRRQNYPEAKEYFKQAATRDSNNYLAHYFYAETLYQEATAGKVAVSDIDQELAKTIIGGLKRSIELMPGFSRSHYMLGHINLVTGRDLAEGLQEMKTALRLEPQNKQFVFMMAQIQARLQDYAGAKKTLEPLLAADAEPGLRSMAESLKNWIDMASSAGSQVVQEPTVRPSGSSQNGGVKLKRSDSGARSLTGPDALVYAASSGDTDSMKAIIDRGVDVNLKDANGRTALTYAAEKGHNGIIELLKAASADLNVVDEDGRTALIYASMNGHGETVKALLDAGADVNAKDNAGETAVIHAAEMGRADIVPLLKAAGADVNAKMLTGQTALIYAALNGHVEAVKALIAAGANPNLKNSAGNSPLFYAVEKGHTQIVEILKTAGAKR